ncbi:ABC transporter permease [Dactylosporangium matsuzakiense]|uniref:ABC transporter permease n=2 Tax=Dactylosporangium matsuzakiense TaxID=53360 RepID=A0A9W6KEJ4_9ACTN|nr:ABC transporter permease [Dactylosporangium matsuzakiense]
MLRASWRRGRAKLVLSIVLTLLAGVAWPMLALSLKIATNEAVAHHVWRATVAGAFVALGAVGALILLHFAYVPYTEAAELAVIDLEAELMDLANGSPGLEHHERPEYADKIAIIQRELSQLPDGFVGLFNTLSLLVSMAVTAVLLAGVNPWLLLLPVAALPPVLAAQRAQAVIERSKDASAETIRRTWHLFRLATTPASAKELRVGRLRDEIGRRYLHHWGRAGAVLWRGQRRAALINAAGQLVFALSYVTAVLVVVRQAIAGTNPIGDIVLVITLAAQVNQQISTGLNLLQQLQRIAQGFTRLRWLRTILRSQQPPAADTPVPAVLRSGIELHDVDFAYPGTDKKILDGVSLTLPAGSTVAIVGENGAGKSTMVKVLCRFYEATAGTVTVDGVDLTRYRLEDWRSRIAAGFQDFVRFELPARQSVGVGDLPRRDDDPAVRAALDRARSADVVERLPEGLDTPLGKSYREGAELSGGQWQKVALGRAMMREDPLLLILDEPTSALDAEAEHRLFEQYALNARRVGRRTGAITVLISHRFSTVRMADLIVVLDGARVAESGDHATLMAAGGLYAELYAVQAAAYQ